MRREYVKYLEDIAHRRRIADSESLAWTCIAPRTRVFEGRKPRRSAEALREHAGEACRAPWPSAGTRGLQTCRGGVRRRVQPSAPVYRLGGLMA